MQVFADAGYKFTTATGVLEPYAGIADISATTSAFAETGGSTALSGTGNTDTQAYSTLGVRFLFPNNGPVTPRFDLGWQHAFNLFQPVQALTFQSLAQSFTVAGVPLAQDAASLQAGLDYAISPQARLSLMYDGSFASTVQNNALRASLEWKF